MPYSTKKRPFHLTTPLSEDVLLLHRFDGEEALSRPFEFRLSMLSEDDAIDAGDLVGKRITLWANDGDDDDDGKCWSGIVASFGRTGSQWCADVGETQELTTYEAVIVPWFWQLRLVEDCRIFQNQSIPDIVDTILGELQLGKHETDLSGTYEALDYCVQYGESSFDFIARLLEDAGIQYFFKHDPDEPADVLVISDRQEKDYKGHVKALRFAANWAEQDESVVFALARRQRMRTGRVLMRDFDFTKPTQNMEAGVDTMLTVGAQKSFQSYRYPGGYLERHAGDDRAKLAMEIEEAAHEVLDGASTLLEIRPGVAFQLDDAPSEMLEPAWRTLHAHHRGENNFDDDSDASYYRNDFTVMPLALPY
ncbi:MAG TPA: type VI secretion system tip protein TssI/VgrG, partial [Rhodanobacter sp.]|nr:type VI secretion system tip protein TssI/VgrG [Rhodanobacter sp.]